MATECSTQLSFGFQPQLRVDFRGGEMTSEAGLLLLREFDHLRGLTQAFDEVVEDGRDTRYVQHTAGDLIRQRVYQIVAGYEDAVDANQLRYDPTLRTVVRPKEPEALLGSQSTISRLENGVGWSDIRRLSELSLRWFLEHGHKVRRSRRQEILLDVDSTDDPVHGGQQLALFHGKYNQRIYHPLLIFEGHTGHLLRSRLRPGTAPDKEGLLVELGSLVKRLRRAYPKAPIRLRADAGFSFPELYDALEAEGVEYLIGIPHHKAFREFTADVVERARKRFERTGKPVRMFTSFRYRAKTWSRQRRVLVKAVVTAQGVNIRCVVTNRRGRSEELFAQYDGRSAVENHIDELKNDLRAERLSCQRFRANAFRLQLHTLAYNLTNLFRQWLRGTALARAETATLRWKLFKVGGRVRQTVRRLWFHLASGWPGRALFLEVHRAIGRPVPAPG